MEGYHVENFGCRANRADGEAIGAELRDRGLAPAACAAAADVVVINTCSVTAQADRTARAFVRRVHRENPAARILVTGCYAQRAPEELAALPGVDLVIGNSHKSLVPELALRSFVPVGELQGADTPPGWRMHPAYVDDGFAHSELAMTAPRSVPGPAGLRRNQTRPNLKVQDGCGNRCSFCVIPQTRGHSRSLPLEDCLRSVEDFVAGGGRELVLSGINLGRWGRDLVPASTLEDLVSAILSRTPLERLRLSSIEPMDWTPQLISLFRSYAMPPSPRLARHAHLPLQSGSDAILRAMHRRYRPWHYAEKVAAVRRHLPDAAIGADVMVGFPGESEALFEESFAFITAQPFTYLHLFPFSPRPGTAAWDLHRRHPVPPPEVERRMKRLRQWIAARNLAFRESFLGRELSAVTLKTPEDEQARGCSRALADNFLEIELADNLPANLSVRALITGIAGNGLAGHVAIGTAP